MSRLLIALSVISLLCLELCLSQNNYRVGFSPLNILSNAVEPVPPPGQTSTDSPTYHDSHLSLQCRGEEITQTSFFGIPSTKYPTKTVDSLKFDIERYVFTDFHDETMGFGLTTFGSNDGDNINIDIKDNIEYVECRFSIRSDFTFAYSDWISLKDYVEYDNCQTQQGFTAEGFGVAAPYKTIKIFAPLDLDSNNWENTLQVLDDGLSEDQLLRSDEYQVFIIETKILLVCKL